MLTTKQQSPMVRLDVRMPRVIAADVRLLATMAGVSESVLLREIVISAVRRRLARRLKGQTVAP